MVTYYVSNFVTSLQTWSGALGAPVAVDCEGTSNR